MEQYIMKGGNPLVGEVTISGAKNAALGILAAAIMTDDDVVIDNLPDVSDINALLEAISHLGAKVERIDRHIVKINAENIHAVTVEDEHMRKIRASYYFIGALLGKYKSAEVPLPGGCTIGSRPIDQHLKGFRALGSDDRPRCCCGPRDRSCGKSYLSGCGFCRRYHQYHDGRNDGGRRDDP